MNTDMRTKIEKLRVNYAKVNGQSFTHFYCPILFKEEDVPLCKAHIINKAFPNSSRAWTVQRSDIDSFYGSKFEADFIDIKYKTKSMSPDKAIIDKTLSKRIKPKILLDNKPVDYFVTQGNIPEYFTPVEFESNGLSVLLVLKIRPEDALAAVGQKWEIETFKDVRLAALVSLIKAAHLTLFEMLGYDYALSDKGYFIGRQILGEFFYQNHDKPKSEVLKNAYPFFREFAHMVRPVQACSLGLQGTITDRLLLICWGSSGSPWALIVFIRTSQQLHSVMIPIDVNTFIDFLRNENDSVKASFCCLEQNYWKIEKESNRIVWPKQGVLYP